MPKTSFPRSRICVNNNLGITYENRIFRKMKTETLRTCSECAHERAYGDGSRDSVENIFASSNWRNMFSDSLKKRVRLDYLNRRSKKKWDTFLNEFSISLRQGKHSGASLCKKWCGLAEAQKPFFWVAETKLAQRSGWKRNMPKFLWSATYSFVELIQLARFLAFTNFLNAFHTGCALEVARAAVY